MSETHFRALACSMALVAPLTASAVPPTAYLENARIIGTGKVLHAYRVPIADDNGKVKYYDLTLNLAISNLGVPAVNQTVVTKRSIRIGTTQFIPGTYTGPGSTTCKLSESIQPGGRALLGLVCQESGVQLTASWVTGPLKGHPMLPELVTAGIDKIPGAANFGWGKIGSDDNRTWYGCFNDPEIISASQAGDTLVLSNYGSDAVINCGVTLVKTAR